MAKTPYNELDSHYRAWTDDNSVRLTRKDGWNEITDAYYGKLPDDWPFTSRVTVPLIHTAILEKNARLSGGKLRGRLVPRENGDILGARINNAVIDFQWDTANDGGSMATKISICDLDTRLYQSKFALVKWRYEENEEGKVTFCGNEMTPLDIRDCGMDYPATHIRDAKWFQHRTWEYIEDLESQGDVDGKPVFQNLGKIKATMIENSKKKSSKSSRKNEYTSRVKQLRGIEDRVGTDIAFPTVEVVTEYRKDKWITFCPEYNEIIREIDNPYKHGKIPVSQLRYYPIQDDPLGESEVEGVISIWKAVQAVVCGFMDEVILKIRPPLKIIASQVRLETIEYAPEAQWLVDRQDAIMEMKSTGDSIQYFQSSFSSLVSSFNTAMGMMSQGTSGVDPFNPQKTATEVKASMAQQNARDQKNQLDLAEFIKDIIMMWQSNNKQFLFSDPKKKEFVLKIMGNDNFEYFKRAGLDEMYLPDESMKMVSDVVMQLSETENPPSDMDIADMMEAGKLPKHPVIENPEEKDLSKLKIKPKMKINEMGDGAELYVVPEDLEGDFDYIADVKSTGLGADQELMMGRQRAIELVSTNQGVLQLLAGEGWKPKIKDLLVSNFEDQGLRDAEKFFEKIDNGQTGNTQNGTQEMGGLIPGITDPGLQGIPQTNTGAGPIQQMAGPSGVPNPQAIPQGIQ